MEVNDHVLHCLSPQTIEIVYDTITLKLCLGTAPRAMSRLDDELVRIGVRSRVRSTLMDMTFEGPGAQTSKLVSTCLKVRIFSNSIHLVCADEVLG